MPLRQDHPLQTDQMNLRHMRVLAEAVRSASVSLAAARCHLSQPAATQAISGLETALGTPLLIRRTRDLTPTPAGALFAARVDTALDHLARGARAALLAQTHLQAGREVQLAFS